MQEQRVVVNLIQDLATPHNNVLIEQFRGRSDAELKLWYAVEQDAGRYQWESDISHDLFPATIYGSGFSWALLRYCLSHPREKFIIVGWMNTNTRLLHLLFFLLRRPFNHWTDLPDPDLNRIGLRRKWLRWIAYRFLRHSNCKIFAVGRKTIDFFRDLGFPADRLVNLPIFVAVDEDLSGYRSKRSELFVHYGLAPDDFLITAGSRLIHAKGYDLLIRGVALLPAEIKIALRVVIVGSGCALEDLKQLTDDLELADHIIFERWLAIDDFKALIANSDAFVHPARFDSYGGTTLGMALGVPVIGTTGAGAAVDRIDPGVNGILYEAENIQALADAIVRLYREPELKRRMGVAARETAAQWHPRRGVEILLQNAV